MQIVIGQDKRRKKIMPKFTKQHYEIIASLFNAFYHSIPPQSQIEWKLYKSIVHAFEQEFTKDNPNFDEYRFEDWAYSE